MYELTQWLIKLILPFLVALILPLTPSLPNEYINSGFEKVEPSPLAQWIDKLATYECPDCGPHYRIVDSNGYYSYSCLQFQKATFDSYSKKYGMNGDIYDCTFQKRLAFRMLSEDTGNWRNWFTSVKVKGLGVPEN